jgi:hypothetical protein
MKFHELLGHVDDQRRLHLALPPDIPPGPVKVMIEVPDEKDAELCPSWAEAVGHAWAADWSDHREDIYTLEDGTPE